MRKSKDASKLFEAEQAHVTRFKLHKVKKHWVVKGKSVSILLAGAALGLGATVFLGDTTVCAAETSQISAIESDAVIEVKVSEGTENPETSTTIPESVTTEADPVVPDQEVSNSEGIGNSNASIENTTGTDLENTSIQKEQVTEGGTKPVIEGGSESPLPIDNTAIKYSLSPQDLESSIEANDTIDETIGQVQQAITSDKEIAPETLGSVASIQKMEDYYEVAYSTGETAKVNILNGHVIRYHMDPAGKFPENPVPRDESHTATITTATQTDYGLDDFNSSALTETDTNFQLETSDILVSFQKDTGLMSITNKQTNEVAVQEEAPLNYQNSCTTQTLTQDEDEYFYGGGTQNGRFSHKGNLVQIVNAQGWTDGSVANPSPFYWSTNGYGVLRNTFQKGTYDFGYQDSSIITTRHDGQDFDAYYFIDADPADILSDYYELTGNPALLPEYGFYEAHLNAYNRDYWNEVPEGTSGAILMTDGKWYKETQPADPESGKTNAGTLESLNGENDNYLFSAKEVLDEYQKADMPLGWFLPNDGYGAGYGQTDSLEGDIQNLKDFVDYANSHGVEVGLWTQQNLHPADPDHPKKGERDIDKEVKDAGITALKTDVAWVGSGYSFGLNGTQDAADVFDAETDGAVRPMIVTICAWAGTQRNAAVWSGDQYGGDWEYIRFHIPTYIGTSLSGQPNIGSDMDGIFGGGDKKINIRDYQWKAFTPIQLNMDGWGSNPKNPFVFDKEATDINRAYLKLKSAMMPYIYSIAHEATDGLPMVRAMFLDFPKDQAAYTTDSQYQYMWGPNLLVAPVYNDTEDEDGNSIRDGIYLPDEDQLWIDLFTGEKIQGGSVLNNVKVPLWKLPVFVKDGAIIPMTNPNNNPTEIDRSNRIYNIYPNGQSDFTQYEDDGISTAYKDGVYATTKITSDGPASNEKGDLTITIGKTEGSYAGMTTDRTTQVNVMTSEVPGSVNALVNGKEIQLTEAKSKEEFENGTNMYYFDSDFQIDSYLTEASGENLGQKFLSIKLGKMNAADSQIQIRVADYVNASKVNGGNKELTDNLAVPANLLAPTESITPTSITLNWDDVDGAASYDVERDGVVFSNVAGTSYTFDGFNYASEHHFRVRGVNDAGVSEWTSLLTVSTSENPYKNTLDGVKATCNIPDHDPIDNLTDKNLTDMWHTDWNTLADPANGKNVVLNFDLGKVYSLDKMEYYPRQDNGGNGNFAQLQYRTSVDGVNWTDYSDTISWKTDLTAKDIDFDGQEMQYVEVKVLKSTNNNGSGTEMLFFKKDGTNGRVLGDVSNNGEIDESDATSYRNYIGIENSDADFEGYVSKGDLNGNGTIDAYDLSFVLSKLDGGISSTSADPVSGSLTLAADKAEYKAGDEISFTLKGTDLANVNAIGARLNFDSTKYELISSPAAAEAAKGMENYSVRREHSDGSESLLLALSNQGAKDLISGDADLLTFTLKVKEDLNASSLDNLTFNITQAMLIGNDMSTAAAPDASLTLIPESDSADKTALDQLVSDNTGKDETSYSEDSWNAFDTALANANDVLENIKATQEEVDQASADLQTAIDGLIVPVKSLKLGLGGIQVVKAGKTLDLLPSISPDNATDSAITWSCSKEGIVSVDENGLLTAVGAGMVKVTAACGDQSTTVTVRVTQ